MPDNSPCRDDVESAARKLLAYCRERDWAGFDPYDALNSTLFRRLGLLRSRLPRLVLTQLLKRAPVNARACLGIEQTQNPKALALFLKALVNLRRAGWFEDLSIVESIVAKLGQLRSRSSPFACWGYSFPWQTRELLVPRGSPNIVCTTFVADALLDAYDLTHDHACLDMAQGAAEYIVHDLYWADGESAAGFSYPSPGVRTQVYNANLLGAAILYRVRSHTGDERLLAPALSVARHAVSRQNDDGSWYYGDLARQRWIDNFHTGFNLLALRDIGKYGGGAEFESALRRGMTFYVDRFVRADGAPRYFHDNAYPIDIHSAAQSIITLVELRELDGSHMPMASSVLAWVLANMWDTRGYFYFQRQRLYTNRVSYMRWSQAWMLLALSVLLRGGQGLERACP